MLYFPRFSSIRARHVALPHVRNAEDEGEQAAQSADDDVADGKEVVLTAERVSGRHHEVLLALESIDGVVVLDDDLVLRRSEVRLNLAPEFSEVGQSGRSHPDDEVL